MVNRNNLDNPQVFRSPQRTGITTPSQDANSSEDSIKYSSRMNIYSDSITENAIKVDDEVTSDVDRPPRLPPRPLNRPVRMINSTNSDAGNFVVLIINYEPIPSTSPVFKGLRNASLVHTLNNNKNSIQFIANKPS